MHLHHDKHLKTYIDNLNKLFVDNPVLQKFSLEQLLMYPRLIPINIRQDVLNQAGGVFNHEFFFNNMQPHNEKNQPSGWLLQAINRTWGSFDKFKAEFSQMALSVFGSGYAVLAADRHGNLCILSTKNQDTVLHLGLKPIIAIDVWEHAYYLKHQNVRAAYIADWFGVVNYDRAELNYVLR